jgi:hypothetical protein
MGRPYGKIWRAVKAEPRALPTMWRPRAAPLAFSGEENMP